MRKIFGKIMIILMVVTMINIPTMLTFAAITEVTPNVHYDASDMFDSVIAETAGFTMSSGQKNIYLEFGDNVFGVPEEQPDGDWFLAEKTKKKDWNINDGTQTLTVNVDSPGDYSVYLLAREYGNRGFSVTMSGEKIVVHTMRIHI